MDRLRSIIPASILLAISCIPSCAGAAPATLDEPAEAPGSLPTERYRAPRARASGTFHQAWSDGAAEVAAYRGSVMRYGARRDAEATLIFVTEPLDRETLVKDDAAPTDRRLDVIKLNLALRFQTGIYPYSVLTSVFAPIDDFGGPRFDPAKITFGEQDWCGGTFAALWPQAGSFREDSHSYFASEGDRQETTPLPPGTLYEDALYIQLRELDGPFAEGGRFDGHIVPSLWRARRDHHGLAARSATIDREARGDRVVFTLHAEGGYERVFEVGTGEGHPILAFRSSDGDDFALVGRERIRYWELHDLGEESARLPLGLSRGLDILPAQASVPSSDEDGWAEVLGAHVRLGRVDYAALVADGPRRSALDEYVASLEAMSEDAPLGAWIDAYNALVVRAIVRAWPIASVRDVAGFFDRVDYAVAGRRRTLDAIENQVIRARFRDARIHTALVCGARSCPALASQPYASGEIDARLEQAAREFVANPTGVRREAGELHVSAIFDWFEADFVRDAGSLGAWLEQRDVPGATSSPRTIDEYDWSLNSP